VAVTVTPGSTAPLVSETVPTISDCPTWADAGTVRSAPSINVKSAKAIFFIATSKQLGQS
jgi:hypothetical protein